MALMEILGAKRMGLEQIDPYQICIATTRKSPFVGNSESRDLLGRSIRTFREDTRFPSEGLAAPSSWPGVGWSDHWSFWQEHYPAIMITDTAMFRNPYYHTRLDTADRIDFARMARVVNGVRKVVKSLATEQ